MIFSILFIEFKFFHYFFQLLSDAIIIFGTIQSAQIISEKNKEPVYLYQFSYQGKYSNSYWPGTNETIGALHEDDLIYLFYSQISTPFINSTDEEGPVVDRFTTLWKNFVETGLGFSATFGDRSFIILQISFIAIFFFSEILRQSLSKF